MDVVDSGGSRVVDQPLEALPALLVDRSGDADPGELGDLLAPQARCASPGADQDAYVGRAPSGHALAVTSTALAATAVLGGCCSLLVVRPQRAR
jgi:hypothetical protein